MKLTWEAAGFYALLVAMLVSFCLYPCLFNTDGAIHAANAKLIVDLLTGHCPLAAEIFQFNDVVLPNWSGHALMAAFIYLGAPVIVAEKIVFCASYALLCLGLRNVMKTCGTNLFLSWLGLGLCLNHELTIYGLYNFVFGLGVLFNALAYYRRNIDIANHKVFISIFTLLATIIWFSHLIAFAGFCLAVLCHEIFILAALRDGKPFIQKLRLFVQKRWPVAVGFIPTLILSCFYFSYEFRQFPFIDAKSAASVFLNGIAQLFMAGFAQVDSNSFLARFPLYLTAFILLGLFLRKISSERKTSALPIILTVLILWFLSFVMPNSMLGGWGINSRLALAGWYFMLCAMAAFSFALWEKRIIFGLAILLFSLNIFLYNAKAFQATRFIQNETRDAPLAENNTLIYSLDLSPSGSFPVDLYPFGRDTAYIRAVGNTVNKAQACVIDLNNYEASLDYFPLRFKKTIPPIGLIWGSPYPYQNAYRRGLVDPDLSFLEHGGRGFPRPISRVYLWGKPDMLLENLPGQFVLARGVYTEKMPYFKIQMNKILTHDYRILSKDASRQMFQAYGLNDRAPYNE